MRVCTTSMYGLTNADEATYFSSPVLIPYTLVLYSSTIDKTTSKLSHDSVKQEDVPWNNSVVQNDSLASSSSSGTSLDSLPEGRLFRRSILQIAKFCNNSLRWASFCAWRASGDSRFPILPIREPTSTPPRTLPRSFASPRSLA